MILSAVMLIPFLIIAVYLFLKLYPKNIPSKFIKTYNCAVLAGAVLFCGIIVLYFYKTTGQSVDKAWWPVLSVLSCLFVFPSTLLAGIIIRSIIINIIIRKDNK